MSLVVVHYLSHICLLVLHRCMVVSEVMSLVYPYGYAYPFTRAWPVRTSPRVRFWLLYSYPTADKLQPAQRSNEKGVGQVK